MKILISLIGVFGLLFLLAVLFAFPTMWIVNSLFSGSFLQSVFGHDQIGLFQAWMLNVLLFRGSTNTGSSK